MGFRDNQDFMSVGQDVSDLLDTNWQYLWGNVMRRGEHETAGFTPSRFNLGNLLLLPCLRRLAFEPNRHRLAVTIITVMATSLDAVDVIRSPFLRSSLLVLFYDDVALRPFLRSKPPGRAGFGICVVCFLHTTITAGLTGNVY